ncbi:hypothetical protein [Pseudacidovorax sp. RU35E]|jgi:hypothetical protein|uniref:hypothetical protein n=1 Tax=Pseudacidovorax sp. RU35E TaxID=1907403 RepID=UPI00095500F9|nr:hypothetical protein [Pseudacidovorax sp. RU35E]SIR00433.1 hypothetical protein SAMN05880557_10795 [Pseudacidovorax sp. RU35E]
MNEAETRAFTGLAELTFQMQGTLQAMQLIQEVLVSALLIEAPHIVDLLESQLAKRLAHGPSVEGPAEEMYVRNIEAFQETLRCLGPAWS